jgi:protein of unknwon function (DUF3310)
MKKEEIINILHSLKNYKEDLIKSGRIDESILWVNDILNGQSDDDLKKAVVNAYLNLTEVIKNEDKTKMPVHSAKFLMDMYIWPLYERMYDSIGPEYFFGGRNASKLALNTFQGVDSTDNINPEHYKTGKYECIDIIEEITKDLKGIDAVCTAKVLKYIWRWQRKNGLEDLKKARWYLDKLINSVEFEENVPKPKEE